MASSLSFGVHKIYFYGNLKSSSVSSLYKLQRVHDSCRTCSLSNLTFTWHIYFTDSF